MKLLVVVSSLTLAALALVGCGVDSATTATAGVDKQAAASTAQPAAGCPMAADGECGSCQHAQAGVCNCPGHAAGGTGDAATCPGHQARAGSGQGMGAGMGTAGAGCQGRGGHGTGCQGMNGPGSCRMGAEQGTGDPATCPHHRANAAARPTE